MSQITITINSDDPTEKKLKTLQNLEKPAPLDPRVVQTLELLKKRLERQIDPVGGSV
jgi:hypothetical protein